MLAGAKMLEVLQTACACHSAGSAVPAGLTGVRGEISGPLARVDLLLQAGVSGSEDEGRNAIGNRLNLALRAGGR